METWTQSCVKGGRCTVARQAVTILSNDAYFAESERPKLEKLAKLPACSLEGSTSELVKMMPSSTELTQFIGLSFTMDQWGSGHAAICDGLRTCVKKALLV